MQLMAYDANAYIVTEYYDYLQAYRTDRFTGFVAAAGPRRPDALPVRHALLPQHPARR